MLTAEDDIEILIDGCKKNDRRAQEILYRRFYVSMSSICIRYISDTQDAMLVLNDGFLKVFSNIGSFNPYKASFYTWIRRIILNSVIDFLRRKPVNYNADFSDLNEEPAFENAMLLEYDADDLLSIIKRLTKATQIVFNLYAVEGYSHREISQLLNISEGTSRWHLSEARRILKQSIEMRKIRL